MKKNFSQLGVISSLLLTMFICTACPDDDDDPELTISSPTNLTINLQANGDGDKTITVSASHTEWSADVSYINGSDWLTLGNKNGSSISFTVTENTTTKPRIAKVRIIASANANLNKEVTVNQIAGESSLTVSRSSVDFNVDGGSQTIQVTSNTSWSLSGKDSWLTVNPSSGTEPSSGFETKEVTITANENTSNETRTCILTFKTNDGKTSVTVTVNQKWLSGLYAEPTNELLMCNDYAHDVSCGPSTKYFYLYLFDLSTYNKMSEREVISQVISQGIDKRELPNDDNFFSWDNLSENSSYVLAIVPYGENDRQGKLYTKQIKTKSSDTEPQLDITHFSINWENESYEWNVTKNTYCYGYYTYAVSSKTKFPTYQWMEKGWFGLIAFPIRSEMEKDASNHLAYINQNQWKKWGYKEFTAVEKFYAHQINDGITIFSAYPRSDLFLQVIIWGTKSNGDLSGNLLFAYADWSDDTSTNRSRAIMPYKLPKKSGTNGGKQKYIRGNLKDFKLIPIN